METLQHKELQVTSYLKLAEIQDNSFNKRRDLEWKITIGLWTSIALITVFMVEKERYFGSDLNIAYMLVFVLSIIRIAKIEQAHETDKRWIKYYRGNAERILLGQEPLEPELESKPGKHKRFKNNVGFFYFLSSTWSWLHIFFTSILLITSANLA
jgi:hypothetical protein